MREKILITKSKESYCVLLIKLLKAKGYTVIEAPQNGEVILSKIESEKPKLVIIDSFMACKDAIGVMQSLTLFRDAPYFFVSMAFGNEKLMQELMINGASYLLYAPYDPTMTAKVIDDYLHMPAEGFTLASTQRITEESVIELLHDMGMSSYLKGYRNLKEAIIYCLQNPGASHAVTKVLYPEVSEKASVSHRAERNIRYALDLTWKNGNREFLEEYFPYKKGKRRCPSNAEFIYAAVEYIQISKRQQFTGKNF